MVERQRKNAYSCISLFSGVGGLDLGLMQAGFDHRVFVDKDEACFESLQRNWPKVPILKESIENVSTAGLLETAGLDFGEAALVSGGPPCQPYSKSGFWINKRWENDKEKDQPRKFNGLNDPRVSTLKEYLRVVREARPLAYFFENGYGLWYKTSRPALEELVRGLQEAGYSTNYKVLNSADYGVPQKRKRLILIGARDNVALKFPKPTHCSKEKLDTHLGHCAPWVSAGQAIGDLDDGEIREGEEVAGKWGHLLPAVPPGDNYLFFTEKRGYPNPIFGWRKKYWNFLLKLSPDLPSWTIQANPGPYVGPFHWKNRRLRIPEIKRLQSFPDNYEVSGSSKIAKRQLGDAVPPLLSKRVGEAILNQIKKL